MHMLFGVAGPVLILYHSNFGLGSTNSNIALFSMLIVAGSGLFGRLFYTRIHDGLYGRKIELGELQSGLSELRQEIGSSEKMDKLLTDYERRISHHRSLLMALFAMPYIYLLSLFTRKRVFKNIHSAMKGSADPGRVKNLLAQLSRYFELNLRVANFTVYERLFSLWHVLHIPLYIMMIISGIIHVIAVHIY